MRPYMKRRLYWLIFLTFIGAVIVLRNDVQTSLPSLPNNEVVDYNGEEMLEHFNNGFKNTTAKKIVKNKILGANKNKEESMLHVKQSYLINASGCQIPDIPAFSDVARDYYKLPTPLSCSRRLRKYRMNRSIKDINKPGDIPETPAGLKCCYRHIIRKFYDDDNYKLTDLCQPVTSLIEDVAGSTDDEIVPEFTYISCHKPENNFEWIDDEYWDIHSFVPIKEDVEFRCDSAPKEDDQLNVLIMGVDSLSRLNMLRQLPLTYSLLTKPPISAEVLLGYNKVADNTFPNLMPVLMGRSIDEVSKACKWPKEHSWHYKFDSCPLIWYDYADKGYRTMYGEECPHLSTFNFQKAGFKNEPTDYYLRPLLLAATNDMGHTHAENCMMCLGSRTSVGVLLDYTNQFVRRFTDKKHFAFTWATSLTHDGLNMAGLADKPLAKAIQRMLNHGDLKRTALIFISDHGSRIGAYRLTPQGRMEERLPFIAVSLPEWFRHKYPAAAANLRLNAGTRLTTPFDVHETLRDLLSPAKFMHDDVIKRRVQELKANITKPRGISLFVEIPEERSCESAGIPRHWCMCLSYRPIPITDDGLKAAANSFVNHINDRFLIEHKNCHQLTLSRIVEARIGAARDIDEEELQTAAGIKDYALTIETNPGGALFEGAVRSYRRRGKKYINRVAFEVADTISRLNRYGNQSACVEDWIVKLYCFCK